MARLKIEFQSMSTGGPKTYENELYELGTWCTAVHSRIGAHFIWPAGFFESTQNLLRTVTRHFAGDRGLSAIREPFSPIEPRFQGCDAEEILWLFVPYRMEQVSVYFRMETRGRTSNHKGAHCQG